ncbi:MAG TPA: carbohydrate porin [Fimbriimonadaceae bacterium]|nr:carbohydrate porin [Fimbriimonadaceae bacterium]
MKKLALFLPIVLGGETCLAQSPLAVDKPEAPVPPKLWSIPYAVNGQLTYISQNLAPFHSPYSGRLSLPSRRETEWTQTYTTYLGIRPARGLELYVDPEWSLGNGVGNGAGVAAYPNGDVLRVPPAGGTGASPVPYFARAFARLTFATGHGEAGVEQQQNQIAGEQPLNRIVITGGKLSVPDIFDTNAYANSTRTQFMNWALINSAAYDYAADLRGYTTGLAVEWIHPTWTIRAGTFSMPTIANGPTLASIFAQNRGDQIELETHPTVLKHEDPAVVRVRAFRNVADMGTYSQALALAKATGAPPDITATRKPGTVKYGFGLSVEQPLGDNGDTGAFARLGWDDGATESFAYTECDTAVSGGIQVSGKRWKAPNDRAAFAFTVDGLAPAHREYLAAGGYGFIIGDGALHYGQEQVLETYYAHQFPKGPMASADLQVIRNPGYNKDRGPAPVFSLRLHWEF